MSWVTAILPASIAATAAFDWTTRPPAEWHDKFDAILLDEMMPGLGGLETLEEIKKINEHVPVIMITKSEAEDLMTKAIGRRIDDYLVKPVSPLQIQAAAATSNTKMTLIQLRFMVFLLPVVTPGAIHRGR